MTSDKISIDDLRRAKAWLKAQDNKYVAYPGSKDNPLLVYPAEKKFLLENGYTGHMQEIGKLI